MVYLRPLLELWDSTNGIWSYKEGEEECDMAIVASLVNIPSGTAIAILYSELTYEIRK